MISDFVAQACPAKGGMSKRPSTDPKTERRCFRAASSSLPQANLCRSAGFSRQILTIPVPLPHECGAPGGLDAALALLLRLLLHLATITPVLYRHPGCASRLPAAFHLSFL
jgi:hypothetical protein